MTTPTITLLTDFGVSDVYVGVMKGVLRRLVPEASVIDLTHEVSPQDVLQGAFLLEQAHRYFPAGTVHLVVVDPGVGTARQRLAIAAGNFYYVGPDNGVLSAALPDSARGNRRNGQAYATRDTKLPASVTAVAIDPTNLGLDNISATFEGRDVFAPAAAHLARGEAIDALGLRLTSMQSFLAFKAAKHGAVLEGLVIHTDRYGNLITDIRASDLPARTAVGIAGRRLPLVHTYADGAGLCAIVGSSGYVEVAVPNASAAATLGVGKGEPVRAFADVSP